MPARGVGELLLHVPAVALQFGHGGGHQRLDGLARFPARPRQAVPQRLAHGGGELGVGGAGGVVELSLLAPQLLAKVLPHALQVGGQGLQPLGHSGQVPGLLLHYLQGCLPLETGGELAERAGDGPVQLPGRQHAFAAAGGGNQAQHGGGGHAGNGGAEGHAQALDRRRQAGPDGLQFGGALQRQHRAAQGFHHADEGAQQAQHDQQPHQVGGENRGRQAAPVALDAQPAGVLQRGVQALQPGLQPAGRVCAALGYVLQGAGQRPRCPPVLEQFDDTQQVDAAYYRGNQQGQGVRTREALAHPQYCGSAQGECDGKK